MTFRFRIIRTKLPIVFQSASQPFLRKPIYDRTPISRRVMRNQFSELQGICEIETDSDGEVTPDLLVDEDVARAERLFKTPLGFATLHILF